jgi:hypothetical protein
MPIRRIPLERHPLGIISNHANPIRRIPSERIPLEGHPFGTINNDKSRPRTIDRERLSLIGGVPEKYQAPR